MLSLKERAAQHARNVRDQSPWKVLVRTEHYTIPGSNGRSLRCIRFHYEDGSVHECGPIRTA